jgi:hypothetical protein
MPRRPWRKGEGPAKRPPFDITPLPPSPDPSHAGAPPSSPAPPTAPAATPPTAPETSPPGLRPKPPGPWPRPAAPRRDRTPPLVATPIQPEVTPSPVAPADVATPAGPARREFPDQLVRFAADSVPAALAFANATAGEDRRQPSGYRCRVSRADGSVWIGLGEQAAAGGAAELAVALGGTIVPLAGPDDLTPLEPVPLLWLASTLMPTAQPRPLPEIAVVTTGRMADPIARRWQRTQAEVTISQLSLEPLGPHAPPSTRPAVLVRVTSRDGLLPQQGIAALTDLPHTVACRVTDRLLIDVRFALSADDRRLVAEIPVGESWLVGARDFGAWRVIGRGPEVVPLARLAFAIPSWDGLSDQAAGTGLAEGALVRVVPATRPDGRADAVLLDDLELDRLRRFLSVSPLAETAFIFPGPGRHLLTEPAGLLTEVPFGMPVCRIGPGGLYLEAGHELDPPVPLAARPELFQLDRDSIVVLCHDSASRLALSGMVPAWRLWLGDAPEVTGGISERGQQLLAGLAPPEQVPAGSAGQATEAAQSGSALDRGQLLIEAEQLEQRGELAGAAQRLEDAGELYRAAVLYQRAAREAARPR